MKILGRMVVLAAAWGLLCGPLMAAARESQDALTLKDGRVVKGQIVEESESKVLMLAQGLKRSYSRGLISKISYGSGPAEEAGPQESHARTETLPRVKPTGRLATDLALRYSVPESEVVWVQRQGVRDADLARLFLVAATAQVLPGVVVKLRLAGMTWEEIYRHFGMESERIYYVPGPWIDYPCYRWDDELGWGLGWGWQGRGWGRGPWGFHHRAWP